MSKIKNAQGRKDGNSGYTRVVGNEALGQLLSRVQATVISNGTELERMITERATCIRDIDAFIEGAIQATIDDGTYLCLKKVFKKSTRYRRGLENIEPDMLIFVVQEYRVCKVIELKDGDAFDTKKSKGEKDHLERFSMVFGSRIPFATSYYICSFNQDDKELIRQGFKNVFALENIMTGRELCALLNIDYDEVISIRKQDAIENLAYLVDELLAISEVQALIKSKL